MCGTKLSTSRDAEPAPVEPAVVVEPPTPDLANLDLGFEVVEGFSHPDWKAIREFVHSRVPRKDWSAALIYIGFKWLEELAADWGGDCRLRSSSRFYCLSDLDSATVQTLLQYAELVVDTIRYDLGDAAWSNSYGKHVLLLFSDADDFYAYISYFYSKGTHNLTTGVFLHRGYRHIALAYTNTLAAQRVLVHELVHNLLCHLPIPLWLNEGLAVVIDRQMARQTFLLSHELAERHRDYWNETNIQRFWAGRSYSDPGGSQLSYSLGEILVTLLSEPKPAFIEFIKAAGWRDAGQDAAVNILGKGLDEVLAGFLGPGNWRPQRKAIKEALTPPAN